MIQLQSSSRTVPGLVRQFSSSCRRLAVDHYQVLGLTPSATRKEIRRKYRELSKKYHPDLNSSGSEADQKSNNDAFIKITKSYEVLSNDSARSRYDSENGSASREQEIRRQEFHNRYYGSSTKSPSGFGGRVYSNLNAGRNRVHRTTGHNFSSIFNGEFRDHSNKNDVPHFDYDKHLQKNINVDKRYTQTHAFKDHDYMLHFIRRQPNASYPSGNNNSNNGNSTRNGSTATNSGFYTYSSSAFDASIYRARTQRDTQNHELEHTNKAPLAVTLVAAISLFYLVSEGGNGNGAEDHRKQK